MPNPRGHKTLEIDEYLHDILRRAARSRGLSVTAIAREYIHADEAEQSRRRRTGIVVSDDTYQHLQEDATARGITITQAARERLTRGLLREATAGYAASEEDASAGDSPAPQPEQ